MKNLIDKIVKFYGYTVHGGPGRHIGVVDGGRALLICPGGKIEEFCDKEGETAEVQAQKYVCEHIDVEAKFFPNVWDDLTHCLPKL
jgi:hypothetical protein